MKAEPPHRACMNCQLSLLHRGPHNEFSFIMIKLTKWVWRRHLLGWPRSLRRTMSSFTVLKILWLLYDWMYLSTHVPVLYSCCSFIKTPWPHPHKKRLSYNKKYSYHLHIFNVHQARHEFKHGLPNNNTIHCNPVNPGHCLSNSLN